jgi:hypothetical protein
MILAFVYLIAGFVTGQTKETSPNALVILKANSIEEMNVTIKE